MEFSLVTRSMYYGEYYEEYIKKQQKKKKKKKKKNNKKTLRQAIRRKSPELLAAGPIILHDNATLHGASGVTSLLGRYEWETLDRPLIPRT